MILVGDEFYDDEVTSGYESPDIYTAMGLLHPGRIHAADAESTCAVCRNLARDADRPTETPAQPILTEPGR